MTRLPTFRLTKKQRFDQGSIVVSPEVFRGQHCNLHFSPVLLQRKFSRQKRNHCFSPVASVYHDCTIFGCCDEEYVPGLQYQCQTVRLERTGSASPDNAGVAISYYHVYSRQPNSQIGWHEVQPTHRFSFKAKAEFDDLA